MLRPEVVMHRIVVVASCLSLTLSLGCDKDDDDDGDSDPSPSGWLVGADGAMHRITEEGELAGYPLQEDDDLYAIACIGVASAWVVGSDGTIVRSRNGGEDWDVIDAGSDADLHAL